MCQDINFIIIIFYVDVPLIPETDVFPTLSKMEIVTYTSF